MKEKRLQLLQVNMGKTKVMRCWNITCQAKNSGKFPCGICRKGVGTNLIQCTVCNLWIHKKCSGFQGRLKRMALSSAAKRVWMEIHQNWKC